MLPAPALTPSRSKTLHRITTLSALALTIAVLWGIIFDRWRPSDWNTPLTYDGDGILYLTYTKLAERGELGLAGHILTQALGAPFVGNLNDFPYTDRSISWVAGFFSHIGGPFFANNLIAVFAHILAAFSFYWAARLWRISKPVAWGLSIPYAFIQYGLLWHTKVLGILFFGLLPLQLYVCWYLSTVPELNWKSPRFRLAVAVAFLSGFNNIYFVVPFALFYLFALLRRIYIKRYNLKLAAVPALFTCLASVIVLSSFVVYWISNGKNSGATFRNYVDLEWGALKPLDLVIPNLGQAFGLFDWLYEKYSSQTSLMFPEQMTVYVGLIGIAGLLLLLWGGMKNSLSRKPLPIPALAIIWTLAFISFGGLVGLFSLITNFYMIRAIQRYTTIISTISFLYFALGLSRWTRNWKNLPKIALVSIICLGGLVDQAWPHFKKWQGSAAIMSQKIEGDITLVTRLEQELPAKSMLFMQPVVPFPESPQRLYGMQDYELLRPFLHSNILRYSYGSHKGRPATEWQQHTAYLPAKEMVSQLESYGFGGILLNRHGYADNADSLLKELGDAGYKPAFEQGDEWVFIPLKASRNPELPFLPYFFAGEWFSAEGTPDNWWRWTSASKNNAIHLYTKKSGRHYLTLSLSAVSARNISLILNGKPLKKFTLPANNLHKDLSLVIDLPQGKNILKISSDQPSIRPSNGDKRALALCIANLSLTPLGDLSSSFDSNWFPQESGNGNWWHWTGKLTGSEIKINNHKEEGTFQVSALIGAANQRKVYIMINGELSTTLDFDQASEQILSIPVELKSGQNSLMLSTDQAPIQPGPQDTRELAFYIKNLSLDPAGNNEN